MYSFWLLLPYFNRHFTYLLIFFSVPVYCYFSFFFQPFISSSFLPHPILIWFPSYSWPYPMTNFSNSSSSHFNPFFPFLKSIYSYYPQFSLSSLRFSPTPNFPISLSSYLNPSLPFLSLPCPLFHHSPPPPISIPHISLVPFQSPAPILFLSPPFPNLPHPPSTHSSHYSHSFPHLFLTPPPLPPWFGYTIKGSDVPLQKLGHEDLLCMVVWYCWMRGRRLGYRMVLIGYQGHGTGLSVMSTVNGTRKRTVCHGGREKKCGSGIFMQ